MSDFEIVGEDGKDGLVVVEIGHREGHCKGVE